MPAIKRKHNTVSIRLSDSMVDKIETLQSLLLNRSFKFYRGETSITEVIEQSINLMYSLLIDNKENFRIDTKNATLDLSVLQNVIFERNK